MARPPRHLYLPDPDRSYWQAAPGTDDPLRYLAWGRRDFRRQEIPASTHEGWVCVVVLEGTPTVLLNNRPIRLGRGFFALARENCPIGWTQKHDGESRILVWMWRRTIHPELTARADDFSSTGKLPAPAIARPQSLHDACRDDVLHPDRFSGAWQHGVQMQVEVLLLRNLLTEAHPACPATSTRIVDEALAWMEAHLDSTEPIARLTDFLGVSQPTLHRIFSSATGKSPLSHFRRLRMEKARSLLATGVCSVKEVALSLGYMQANDFSRAYQKHFGFSPGSWRHPGL